MLVLSLGEDGSVEIGSEEDILMETAARVSVVEVRNGKVKLGFDFPSTVKVHRKEVADRIRAGEEQ